jgi:thioredoxin 1
MRRWIICSGILAALLGLSHAETAALFPPLLQWKAAVVRRNAGPLKGFYSTEPAARISVVTKGSSEISVESDADFWAGLRATRLELKVSQSADPQPGIHQVNFEATVHTAPPGRTLYVVVTQLWQKQGNAWKLLAAERTDERKLEQPLSVAEKLYPEGVNARQEVQAALARAAKAQKRVLVIFGADWCFDCHVLEKAFHRPDIAPILNSNFEVVHVDIGDGNKNADLMNQYQVPMDRKVPAVAVLDPAGKLLYSQRNGEFKDARILGPEDLLAFLNQWKPNRGS